MMFYAILVYFDENVHEQLTEEETETLMKSNDAHVEKYKDRVKAAAALRGVGTATTVRVRDGKTLISSGPFAETKEQLGGWSLIECENLDEAIELASGAPDAAHGSIEIRPVWGHMEA